MYPGTLSREGFVFQVNYILQEALQCVCFFFFFFLQLPGFPPGFGVSGIGGDHQKDPPKNFFLPAKAVVARFARASLQATAWRGEGCTRFDSSHVKLHSCVVW